jgi:hypothetical protein
MDHLHPSNANNAECICPMIFSHDVNDDGNIDDGTESRDNYVELRESDSESAEDAMSDDGCCNEVDVTDSCFIGKDKTKWGKVKSTIHIPCRWQNSLTEFPGVTGQARNAIMPFQVWNCLTTDEILDYIVQHTN